LGILRGKIPIYDLHARISLQINRAILGDIPVVVHEHEPKVKIKPAVIIARSPTFSEPTAADDRVQFEVGSATLEEKGLYKSVRSLPGLSVQSNPIRPIVLMWRVVARVHVD